MGLLKQCCGYDSDTGSAALFYHIINTVCILACWYDE